MWHIGSLIRNKVAHFADASVKVGHTWDPHCRVSDTETQLRYSWHSCSCCCRVFPGVWWSSATTEICHPVQNEILGCLLKTTLISCSDSLLMYDSGPGKPQARYIHHWIASIPVCSVLCVLVLFIRIMLSSTEIRWMQYTQIVIYQYTTSLGAGGSSRTAAAHISIYAWLGDKHGCWNALNSQLHVNLSIGGRWSGRTER